jgi:zinc transport system substrate-binding protein
MRMGLAVVCAFAVLAAAGSCRPAGKSAGDGPHKIKVVATLFPLYDMARNIGGDRADVSLLLPPGVEAHSFEPRPSDIVEINEADIFVYTGKFMEPWAESIIKGAANRTLIVVDASRDTKMIPEVFHDGDGRSGRPDPHIWLDFDNAKIMAENIAQAFKAKDSAEKGFYERNAVHYKARLTELDSAYKASLGSCKKREIIYAGHYAFGYMANRYGLTYLAAQGASPDAEATARDLVRLVEQIRRDRIKYVFYEELSSPKVAETLAGETGARMLQLNAAHNVARDQLFKGTSFFDILKSDLDNLKTGLECR